VCPLKGHPIFQDIHYFTDDSGIITGILLKSPSPSSASLDESREIFQHARATLKLALGEGQSYLKSGDPTYWPARDASERIVTLTTTDEGQTVLAIGAVGPDAARIPANGHARDLVRAQKLWETIATSPALMTKPLGGT